MDKHNMPSTPMRRGQARQHSANHLKPSDANRVYVQPASPEVISSLITSLSIISRPASQLFDNPQEEYSRTFESTAQGNANDRPMYSKSSASRGSFGVDYGAYSQPSLVEYQDVISLDELAASGPVIRTSKPPSGFSQLTAPKSPRDNTSFKSILARGSRPSSKGSNDRDDASSIGNLSIEPGLAPSGHELRRKTSTDSWGKKQHRQNKGLMYTSSKERLRDADRKRTNTQRGDSLERGLGIDRINMSHFTNDTFMAERSIREEGVEQGERSRLAVRTDLVDTSPSVGAISPAFSSHSSGGIGSGRPIPPRESSLKNRSKKRSNRSSRRESKNDETASSSVIKEEEDPALIDSTYKTRKTAPRDVVEDVSPAPKSSLLETPLVPRDIAVPENRSPETSNTGQTLQQMLDGDDDGAPSPAVSQRRPHLTNQERRSSSNDRKTERNTSESLGNIQLKREGSKLKRLSGPLSPTLPNPSRRASQGPPSKETRVPQVTVDDRPKSADSVDDAVESYLCSPRLSQKIKHPQTGRTISFSEVGDSEGFAVFCCVGMGLTRYITAFYDELALTLKLRLITPDRPGVGDSEPYTDGTSTPLGWPDDVYSICQALKITKFSILAHSAGAIYALATALRMPQHIRGRIHLLAPWIPPSQMNVLGKSLSPPTNSIPTSQRILRALPTPMLKVANSSFMSATSSSITSSLPKSPRRGKRKSTPATGKDTPTTTGRSSATPGLDKENVGPGSLGYPKSREENAMNSAASNPDDPNHETAIAASAAQSRMEKERQTVYDTRLTHAIWELATSNANPAVDLLVCLERRHTIGFRYVDINRAVLIHHGSKDTRVPVENVKWLGKMMRRCEVRILEGEGHGLMASPSVMSGVLMEIASEWEAWTRLVEKRPEVGRDAAGARARAKSLKERASIGAFRADR